MSHRKEKQRIANGGLPAGAVPADASKQIPVSPYGSTKKFYGDIAFKCSLTNVCNSSVVAGCIV